MRTGEGIWKVKVEEEHGPAVGRTYSPDSAGTSGRSGYSGIKDMYVEAFEKNRSKSSLACI